MSIEKCVPLDVLIKSNAVKTHWEDLTTAHDVILSPVGSVIKKVPLEDDYEMSIRNPWNLVELCFQCCYNNEIKGGRKTSNGTETVDSTAAFCLFV